MRDLTEEELTLLKEVYDSCMKLAETGDTRAKSFANKFTSLDNFIEEQKGSVIVNPIIMGCPDKTFKEFLEYTITVNEGLLSK